jgi:uncharacterized protein YhbP (UPF0306 family)
MVSSIFQSRHGAMNDDLTARIADFLAAHHVLSLATHGPDGPHAANLFYACDGLALVWLSETDTRHSRDVAADARVAATIAPDYADFSAIRGVQVFGAARQIVAADERQHHLALLEARYPFLRKLKSGPAKLQEGYARASPYRLQPLRMVLIDNSKGFGHKETIEFPVERRAREGT